MCVDVLQMMHSSIFLYQANQFPINEMGITKFSVPLWFMRFGTFITFSDIFVLYYKSGAS